MGLFDENPESQRATGVHQHAQRRDRAKVKNTLGASWQCMDEYTRQLVRVQPPKQVFGSRSGKRLDRGLVCAGGQEEMNKIFDRRVLEVIRKSDAVGGRHTSSGWVHHTSGDEVCSRLWRGDML